jgi:hypothetical protein
VSALDERRVLREVKRVVSSASEHSSKRLACGFDAETGGTTEPDANLASVGGGLGHCGTSSTSEPEERLGAVPLWGFVPAWRAADQPHPLGDMRYWTHEETR